MSGVRGSGDRAPRWDGTRYHDRTGRAVGSVVDHGLGAPSWLAVVWLDGGPVELGWHHTQGGARLAVEHVVALGEADHPIPADANLEPRARDTPDVPGSGSGQG